MGATGVQDCFSTHRILQGTPVGIVEFVTTAYAREDSQDVKSCYLPMDCPVCGRRRMEWDGKVLSCEKCTTSSEWDGFTTDRYKGAVTYEQIGTITDLREIEAAARKFLVQWDHPEKYRLNGDRYVDDLRVALRDSP